MFGTLHLAALAVSAVLIIAGVVAARRVPMKTLLKIMLGIGIVSETIKVFAYILMNEAKLGGYLPKTDLPFHLCSIQIIFLAVLNLTSNKKVRRTLCAFMLPSCLWGGLAALLIPTSSSVGSLGVITFQYFIYHSALVVLALHMLTSPEMPFTVKDYRTALIMLGCVFFAAIYINSILYDGTPKINFMYVVAPPKDGLPFLNKENGWLVYILRYALVCVVLVTLTYIKQIIRAIFRGGKGEGGMSRRARRRRQYR